ncbi:MAG TPA: cytochrome P450 [Intrasporangium sp.]|uniref:cytochrome P450 n=1 Tax=Intrasporangium sp. TaxID=1925024 RepID=UPI002D78A3A1|nr:cytochrome P450 [Intrasporangium sp.]HET7397396.1 cytochrome P450 [Intrasporangium sp.]
MTDRQTAGDDVARVVDDGLVFDPHSADLTPERAYELYELLRTTCPVAHGEKYGGYWSLARYEDIKAVAADHQRFSSAGGVYVPAVSEHRFPPIDVDPPEHAAFRKLIAPLTSAAAAKQMEPAIQATVDRLIDGFIDGGRAELVEQMAIPLPLDVITQLYGLHPDQANDIRAYSLEFLEHASGSQGQDVITRVADYWMGVFQERRKHPGDDFISQLLAINFELEVPDEELANMMFILTYAGHDSTALGLGNMLLYLAEHPQVHGHLLEDERRIPTAIDEILRFNAPLQWFPRLATEDVTIGDKTVCAGERVMLLFGSANRDSDAFPDADSIVLDRKPNRHLSFGAGIHTCPGMPLAKAEIRIAVTSMLKRLPGFRLDGPAERTSPLEGGGRHLGVRHLPVTW